ncbi:hypothetical protein FraEuI1c_6949 [Pseudofrankia inefficax]|uniref:DUF397 domain-containing protein n=1 Tax=Pseudofrankia inefficax (strain DSM 45817 / CECT 9037 / DDB 130130 / EuI1c) TaxID=298654 RepID=E3IVY9_PSEI1|nr:DUF397 domain-containing protein [Pseudofrankia inefficax]ADP84917.1 hypothetical protein FraEuI1c_6949 [Pseudofrankia inefficax]
MTAAPTSRLADGRTGSPGWRRPSLGDPKVVDCVEAAWELPDVAVVLRGSLSGATVISSGAWRSFLAAVKRGEYDQLPSAEGRQTQPANDHVEGDGS